MKTYYINILFFILFLYFSSVESQLNVQLEVNKAFNSTTQTFNKIDMIYYEISNDMQYITYNYYLKYKYKNLKTTYASIKSNFSSIQKKINTQKYDKKILLKEIDTLNKDIKVFSKICSEVKLSYDGYQKNKRVIKNLFLIFFCTLLVTIVSMIVVIGFISLIFINRNNKPLKDIDIPSTTNVNKSSDSESDEINTLNDESVRMLNNEVKATKNIISIKKRKKNIISRKYN